MHEQSLVRSLLSQVEQLRIDYGADSVTRIDVEIGPLSGVEPHLVRAAFDRLVAEVLPREIELVLHDVPLRCQCRNCNTQWSAESFRFLCPECGSGAVQVIGGAAFVLKQITVCVPAEAEMSP